MALPKSPDRSDSAAANKVDSGLSRRKLLQAGTIAAAGGAALLSGERSVAAQDSSSAARREPGDLAGRRFRAWVHRSFGPGQTGGVEELILRPIGERQVVVRTEAAQCCYSNVGMFLGGPDASASAAGYAAPDGSAMILGHGGAGVVEAVGAQVRRVRVGDRVIVGVTPECGECHLCLQGRADWCLFLFGRVGDPPFAGNGEPPVVVAETQDGVEVVQATDIGGHAELMVTFEEWCVPIASTVSSAELSLLSCVAGTGLGTTMTLSPVRPGSDVVVFGAGAVGLAAIEGARIMGASRIIAVEPIRMRRELALKVGATMALDPNVEGDGLVARLRDLCSGTTDDIFTGSKPRTVYGRGPDFVIEAVGGDQFPPAVEAGPDPTGLLPLQQAWDACPPGGHLITTSIGHQGNVTFQGTDWTLMGRTHHPAQYGGTNLKRDVPGYVKLIEQGAFDAASLITTTYPLEATRDAYQAAADRTDVNAIIVYS